MLTSYIPIHKSVSLKSLPPQYEELQSHHHNSPCSQPLWERPSLSPYIETIQCTYIHSRNNIIIDLPCLCLFELPLNILAPYSFLCHNIAVPVCSMRVRFVWRFVRYILDCLHTCSNALLMITAVGHWQPVPSWGSLTSHTVCDGQRQLQTWSKSCMCH